MGTRIATLSSACLLLLACTTDRLTSPPNTASEEPGVPTTFGAPTATPQSPDVAPAAEPDVAPVDVPPTPVDTTDAWDATDTPAPVDAEPPDVPTPVTCTDHDDDGRGPGCAAGPDCDDTNPHFAADCPDCAAAVAANCPCAPGTEQAYCFEGPKEAAGVGTCTLGVRLCIDGYWSECSGDIAPEPEVCDGLDNDCDGTADDLEGCNDPPPCTDEDGDGYGAGCPKGDDCDDTNPKLGATCPNCAAAVATGCACKNPGQTSMCYTGPTETLSQGSCKPGERACADGYWTECLGQTLPTPEICDDADNDCDGTADEGLADCIKPEDCIDVDQDGHGEGCPKGADCDDGNPNFWAECPNCMVEAAKGCPCAEAGKTTLCYSGDKSLIGKGICASGGRTCEGGYWSGCVAEVLPAAESCNGLDDDCDGSVDEGLPGCVAPPDCTDDDGDGYGQGCAKGSDCNDGNPNFTTDCPDCAQANHPGCPCTNAGQQTFCYSGDQSLVGKGVCKAGKRICGGGYWSECLGEVLPSGEQCDDLDNDCNGTVDEGVPGCVKPPDCKDQDGDGYGEGCAKGPDCDDKNPNFTTTCKSCAEANYTGCPCGALGQTQLCYAGDPALIGIGDCTAGERACMGGFWTECLGEVLPTNETCDGFDNDCDGKVDEGVLGECGDCNQLCFADSDGAGGNAPFAPTPDNSTGGIVLTPEGWLTLSESSYNLHFIWIANSSENTVSKLDTITGKELARYKVCSDPSRTAVAPNGDGWAACRGDAKVVKIENIIEKCPDKNGNGVIETSVDKNGDGVIQSGEMLPKGQDECVLFTVQPDGSSSIARALGITYDSTAWVGFWNTKKLRRLHADTGAVLDTVSIPANPYGLAIDSKGVIWVSGRGGGLLVRVHPDTHAVSTYKPSGCFEPYGIGIDELDRVWIGNCCCSHVAYVFNPAGGGWASVSTGARPRGIASDRNGHVYVANDESSKVAKINSKTLKLEGTASLGSGKYPVGIAVDSNGYVWAVNQSASSATKIDPDTLTKVLEHPVGSGPYTYSDMTGATFFKSITPNGAYRVTYEAPALDEYLSEWYEIVWEKVWVEYAAPPGTHIDLRARAAKTKAGLATAPWTAAQGPFPPKGFPVDLDKALGPAAHGASFLEVEVSLAASESTKPVVKKISLQYGAKQKN